MPNNVPFTTPQHSPEELVRIKQHGGGEAEHLVTATHFKEVVKHFRARARASRF